jgi:predicted RNase H-like HicB family nuclease
MARAFRAALFVSFRARQLALTDKTTDSSRGGGPHTRAASVPPASKRCLFTRQLLKPSIALLAPGGAMSWYSLDMSRSGLDGYKIVLYRQDDGSWIAEVPAISGCYALMATREEALAELAHVFDMIAEEYQERGAPLPEDTTEIVSA